MSNIQVVVRCRGRNDREIASKSPVVVDIPQEGSSMVVLNPIRSATTPVIDNLQSKSYTVDKVYGSESSQEKLYKDIAYPLFKDFLGGYNVTVLAYGQTGTGKTYTMCGGGFEQATLKDDAGIIPRILVDLFDSLNRDTTSDYMVKCSFLELYNEELKDLFREDASTNPTLRIYESKKKSRGNANPSFTRSNSPKNRSFTGSVPGSVSSSVSNSVSGPAPGSNGQSIYVHGLQEIHVSDAQYALQLLRKGLNRRMVASTKMNEASSRSHTIFSIILYHKHRNLDLFKVSKINLVDLAGSENISRSGSVNQRAKEAGLINQSLLTLGRVINSLVSDSNTNNNNNNNINNSHIPYRESKLTRLLQDSLGGETKTALIATISPAKVNADETTSTLEYASRAKNIKNKPQMNEESEYFIKKTLIRDLSKEILRLNDDLNASRQKNGIWLDERNYDSILLQQESMKTELRESQLVISSLNSKIDLLMNSKSVNEEEIKNLKIEAITAKEDIKKAEVESGSLKTTVDELNAKLGRVSNNLKIVTEEKVQMEANMTSQVQVVDQILVNYQDADLTKGWTQLNLGLIDIANATKSKLEGLQQEMSNSFKKEIPIELREITKVIGDFEGEISRYTKTQFNYLDKIEDFNSNFTHEAIKKLLDSELVQNIVDTYVDQKVKQRITDVYEGLKQNMQRIIDEANAKHLGVLKESMIDLSKEINTSQSVKLNGAIDEWKENIDTTMDRNRIDIEEFNKISQDFKFCSTTSLDKVGDNIGNLVSNKIGPTLSALEKGINNNSEDGLRTIKAMETRIKETTESQVVKLRNLQRDLNPTDNRINGGENNERRIRSRLSSPLRPQLAHLSPLQARKEFVRSASLSPEKSAHFLKSKIPQLSKQNSFKKQKL